MATMKLGIGNLHSGTYDAKVYSSCILTLAKERKQKSKGCLCANRTAGQGQMLYQHTFFSSWLRCQR